MNEQQKHSSTKSNQNIELFDSPRGSLNKQQSLVDRFKFNQVNLRNKFKQYITRQKLRYPLTSKQIKTEPYDQSDYGSSLSLKHIREEKLQLQNQMQHHLNETSYLEHKKHQRQRTFYLLKQKYDRVKSIRKDREQDMNRLQRTIKNIQLQIKKQKTKYRKSIEESRYRIERSRVACEGRKVMMGQQTRREKELFSQYLSHQKEVDNIAKRTRHQQIRSEERSVYLTRSRVESQKKQQADQTKLERLMRQMAQKQQIKITTSRVKKQNDKRVISIKHINQVLENKIRKYRENLAERRLTPQRNIRISHKKNSSYTQEIEKTSTDPGFFSPPRIISCQKGEK